MRVENEINNQFENLAVRELVENETVWLTQAQMSALFGRSQPVISRHISNIFREKELDEESNMHFLLHFLHIANFSKMETAPVLDCEM